jgi:phage gp29-like protein
MANKVTETPSKVAKNHTATYAAKAIKKTLSQTRKDIADWKNAIRYATLDKDPKRAQLQDIFDDIAQDALLTSQINNRHEQTIASPFELVTLDNKVDDKVTEALQSIPIIQDLFKAILDSEIYGYSLVELSTQGGLQSIDVIPRQNIIPDNGRFYPNITQNNYIEYRTVSEYGRWIMEFNSGHFGLLNKAVPHILFKKFAQSCWSELCEIFGIPPRYMKTNTQDPNMLDRAETMMREIGAAAWFIIDSTEDFQFAQGVNTNGDVYNNLIHLCNNETSMLISGAIIGQDTENGNYSKEKAGIAILDRLIQSDKRMTEVYMNTTVLPALARIGWIPSTTSRFRFAAVEDGDKLWTYTQALLPYKDVDNAWITEKFGIPVKDKTFGEGEGEQMSAGNSDFFAEGQFA